MRKDARGYFYFVDRIGDTFRWKGENVSTAQVAEIISGFPGVLEASVYGVAVPGQEGRAGMAALSLDGDIDLAAFRRHLAEHLPVFARPVFLRLGGPIEVTPTFKQKKFNLVAQGFDPARTRDPVYLDDPERRAFVRVDPELYGRLQAGQVRL
jgi:fatty-acyl-CoA synthase